VAPRPCREGVLLSPLLFYADWSYAEVGEEHGDSQGTALRLREPALSADLHRERGYGSLLCP